jgi:hypothetical protein
MMQELARPAPGAEAVRRSDGKAAQAITAPGVSPTCADPAKLITNDCIKP